MNNIVVGSLGVCPCVVCVAVTNNPTTILVFLGLVSITCIAVMVNIVGGCIRREKRLKNINVRRRALNA